jgi:hypothetical protein
MTDLGEEWNAALVELRGRMDRQTFDRLFRGSFLVRVEQAREAAEAGAGPSQGMPSQSQGMPSQSRGMPGQSRGMLAVWRVAVRSEAIRPWLERYCAQVADSARLVAGRPVRVTFEVATPELLAQYHQAWDRERPQFLPSPGPAVSEAPPCRDRSQPASGSRPPGAPAVTWSSAAGQ